jgi:hypothetical protein
MGSSVTVDILIALAMCWHLYHNKTGFPKQVFNLSSLQQNH